ncbi:BadF/BadG/BcrA/BcrD ATPase family protein [uncultured Paraglaciecola sp.]|uniref:BadF/BadG/BcrA/BcrD ATPase family protein n=1 Tax=uncultured Paraglaciecola sp. TaxID=1765024 RepID=UPI0026303A21|nr:BadF/BadG/BcrA/BcrD ATPase family protein [uncultured Paraglaciecola sp.]
MIDNTTLYIGIDGGGTKCSAHLFNAELQVLGRGISGPANASRDIKQTFVSMLESVQLALIDAKLSPATIGQLHVAAGLAGAFVPSAKAQLTAWQHPFASFTASTDLTAAGYGAHGAKDGALLIIGTGSSAACIQAGVVTQFGGHGFLLGDKGGGAWLGRSAVISTLEAMDNVITTTELHHKVLQQLSLTTTDSLVQKMLNATSSEFAALAPVVIELAKQNDANAVDLITQASDYLEKLSFRALRNSTFDLVLTGGLAAYFENKFSPALRSRIKQAKNTPERGALHMLPAKLQPRYLLDESLPC